MSEWHKTANYRARALQSQVLNSTLQWVKAYPDYEPPFSVLDGIRQNADRGLDVQENNSDKEADMVVRVNMPITPVASPQLFESFIPKHLRQAIVQLSLL